MKHDPTDPGGEYYRAYYELSDEESPFCAKEGVGVEIPAGESITEEVIGMILDRAAKGIETYGHPIDPFDGRDWLTEAIEEGIDLVVYLITMRRKLTTSTE